MGNPTGNNSANVWVDNLGELYINMTCNINYEPLHGNLCFMAKQS